MKSWTRPFVIYGINPMVGFVGSGVMARCIDSAFTVNWFGNPRVHYGATSFLKL